MTTQLSTLSQLAAEIEGARVLSPTRSLAVSLIRSAQVALDQADSASKVNDIRNKVRAFEVYFKQQRAELINSNLIVAQRLRTERKLGELLFYGDKNKGGNPNWYHDDTGRVPTYAEQGFSKAEASRWQLIARIAPEDFETWIESHLESEELSTAGAYRIAKSLFREHQRAANLELVAALPADYLETGGKFSTLAIDPPWDWGDEGDIDQFGRAKPPYATMPFEEIRALPIASYAAENAHVYLWITNRSLPKGFELLEAWGFRYITCLTWCKPSFGMGNYFRGSTEQILFGVRGSLSLQRHDAGTWFQAPRGENGHSSKPEEFYELVETCSPPPYLEFFARTERAGWFCKGAEVRHD